ncbi:MAG: hypothetical protein KGY81_05140, partial [Phycisphaerae bacterium]|nr:hypothetical protein [Phycisphaerae bacterium]
MDLRTKICIWVILIGMGNFLAYTIGYTILGGEAVRGEAYLIEGTEKDYYFLDSGKEVSWDQFLYSGIHSISIWLTVAAIMMAMLTLAKDRIVDSMHEAVVRGRTLCTVLAVAIGFCTAGLMFQFVREFVQHFENPTVITSKADLPPGPSNPPKRDNAEAPADHAHDNAAPRDDLARS